MQFSFKTTYEYLNVAYNLNTKDVISDIKDIDFTSGNSICFKDDSLMIKNNINVDCKIANKILEKIENLVSKLQKDQKLIIFASDAFLTTEKENMVEIKNTLKNKYLAEIIQTSLYGNFYKHENRDYQYYPNSAAIMVLKNDSKSVRFINNLGWVYDEPGLGESNFKEIVVDKKELANTNNLLPSFVIMKEESKKYDLTLQDIADIRQGCYIKRVVSTSMPYEYDEDRDGVVFKPVEIKNLNETVLTGLNFSLVSKKSAKLDRHYLKKGDLVITVKAANMKAAIVDADVSEKLVASSNLIVISPKNSVAPELILAYLQSDAFNGFVIKNIVAEYVKKINVEQLKKAPIPLSREDVFNSETSQKYKNLINSREQIAKNVKGLSNSKEMFRSEVNNTF